MDEAEKVRFAGLIGGEKGGLISLAQDFMKLRLSFTDTSRALLAGDQEVTSMRLRTNKHEIIIAPYSCRDMTAKDGQVGNLPFVSVNEYHVLEEFTLVVVHNPNYTSEKKSEVLIEFFYIFNLMQGAVGHVEHE